MVPAALNNLFPFDDDWRGVTLTSHTHTLSFTQCQL
jgi:hypothetical protein